MCVIAKNENLYVKEFVEYYKKIGYNNIFIYDNNEKNGENFYEVIDNHIKKGFVEIINWTDRNNSSPQLDAYRDCYKRKNTLYNWLSFFDMDEFLEINKKYKYIQHFLNDKIFDYCKVIKINWLMNTDENTLYYDKKPLQERIKYFNYSSTSNKHIKSTVKGNLSINYWEQAPTAHSSSLNITTCSSSGKIIRSDSPFNEPPDFTNAKLKHYYYKSFEELCLKIKRGRVSLSKIKREEYMFNVYKQLYIENKNNNEKLIIIDKIFNYSINNLSSFNKSLIL